MNRTNFVLVSNLPHGFNNAGEMCSLFSACGVVQDMTAVSPTMVIISYAMRSGAENAAFALNGASVCGYSITVKLHFKNSDPQFLSLPEYKKLGQYICNDGHVMDPNTFLPWSRSGMSPRNNLIGFSGPSQVSSLMPDYRSVDTSSIQPAARINNHNNANEDFLSRNTIPWTKSCSSTSTDCNICLTDLEDNSSYSSSTNLAQVLSLQNCKHPFHTACLLALMKNNPSPFLQCPTCKRVHGVRTGTRPLNGTMKHRLIGSSLPGYSGCGTIELVFTFWAGIQGPEHPNPGQPYKLIGFPRVAYLPDNADGLKALHGLYLAWEQRLLFTIGRSITTGMDNCVTWNDIHLKTGRNGGEHSYPDDHYLQNLAQDLAGFGITEAEISSHMSKNSELKRRGCAI